MKTKILFLTGMFLLSSFYAFSQRNPNKEILVFFNKGVSQKVVTKQGKAYKTTIVSDAKLKSSLKDIGIYEAMLEVAIPDFDRKDTLKVLTDGRKLYQADMSKLYRINVSEGQSRTELIQQLNSLPEVLYAESNGSASPNVIPSDEFYSEQWGLKNNLHPGRDIHAEGAWDIYTGNPNNIIAIIDGGTNKNHPDLNDKIAGGDDGYGWQGHGIHVSGIAASESNNNQGVSGVDWNARIHAQRIDNVSDDAAIYQAIVDAVNYSSNVYVLNNSWGLTDVYHNPGRYSSTVKLAYVYAYNANRTMVSAMGNHNTTHPGVTNYPAGFGIGIAVGATDDMDNIAYFSVKGNYIDVAAPGVGIYSTLNNDYDNMDGTSMAAPFVSGIASLLKGYKSNLSNDDIENIIRLSADKVQGMNDNNYTTTYGYGRVNAEQALRYLQSPYSLNQWTTSGGSVVSSTGQYLHTFIGPGLLSGGTYIVKRHEVRKTVSYPQSFYELVGVWGRGVSTNGWNQSNPNLGKKFCEVVPGTESTTGVTLQTYVYEVWNISGYYAGYYPTTPANVQFAYTALGTIAPRVYGTNIVCTSSSTFTLQNRPPGSTISWTKSSNLTYVSGQGTNNYTAKAVNSSTSGPGWVQATLNVPGGTVELPPKEVWVGKPYAPTSIMFMPYNPYVGGQSVDAFVSSNNPHQANVTYQWDGGPHSLNPESIDWSSVSFKTINTQYWYSTIFRVSASNTCGTSLAYSKLLTVKEQPNGGGEIPERGGNAVAKHLSISPNPASNHIKVTETNSIGDDQPWELRLISAQGFVVYSTSTSLPKTIKINELQLGVYILHAKKGNHVEQHRLSVE